MVKGDEKLLFLADIDGEVDTHIARLVASAGPVFDAIFTHVEDPPATPVASNPERVIRWLRHHIREPLDTYFAYEDASVQDIKAAARAAGFTGHTSQGTLLTYMTFKSRLRAFAVKLVAGALVGERAYKGSDALGTLHLAHFVPFENNNIGFFTVFDGDFAKYIQDFADKNSFIFDTLFPHIIGAPPTPVAQNAQAFYQWALDNNYPPIGFYSAYPGLSVLDIRALLADRRHNRPPLDSSGGTWSRTQITPEVRGGTGAHHTRRTGDQGPGAASPTAWAMAACKTSDGNVRARPRGHSGVHSPRVPHADGAAFLVDGRHAGTRAPATRTARERRRIRRPTNHDCRGLARGVRARTGRQSRGCPASHARLLPQHRDHLARTGGAGDTSTRPQRSRSSHLVRSSKEPRNERRWSEIPAQVRPSTGVAVLDKGRITSW